MLQNPYNYRYRSSPSFSFHLDIQAKKYLSLNDCLEDNHHKADFLVAQTSLDRTIYQLSLVRQELGHRNLFHGISGLTSWHQQIPLPVEWNTAPMLTRAISI